MEPNLMHPSEVSMERLASTGMGIADGLGQGAIDLSSFDDYGRYSRELFMYDPAGREQQRVPSPLTPIPSSLLQALLRQDSIF